MFKRIFLHGAMGGLIGYLLLHPASMFIYHYYEKSTVMVADLLSLTFSIHHLPMAFFFILIGIFLGIIQALYIDRISSLYEKVRQLSITDSLTSLYNRRYFMDKLEDEIDRATRYDRNLYLLLIDIDDFKKLNDTHGHQKGDKILEDFGYKLKKSIRRPDIAARYGGEEFVILMPEADVMSAQEVAKRLCKEISEHTFIDNELCDSKLTISVGVAGFPADARDATDLIKKADAELYRAKATGKNTVCTSCLNEMLSPLK